MSSVTLADHCLKFRECLHECGAYCCKVFDEICTCYVDNNDQKVAVTKLREMASFLTNHLHQVECLLHIIQACGQGNRDKYLAAVDEKISYFFAHDN